ncbi:MAG: UPF0182 family protein, partial [Actinomycetota bacterium]|nr:UPF0182 family protein [Actinomycetota bacterium]
MAQQPVSRARMVVAIIATAVFLGMPLLGWLATVYTDWLWYLDLGEQQVFIVRIVSSVATAAIFGVFAFATIFVNVRIARGLAPRAVL